MLGDCHRAVRRICNDEVQGSFIVGNSPNKRQKAARGLMGSYIQKIVDFYLLDFTLLFSKPLFS
jgi:hypothetical protein